jgi:hypothetical protein
MTLSHPYATLDSSVIALQADTKGKGRWIENQLRYLIAAPIFAAYYFA